MQVLEFWNLRSWIFFISLFLPFFLLSLFSYFFYQLLILTVCVFIISGLVTAIRLSRARLRPILGTLILLVALWGAYYIIPEFNFWLTSSIRQSVVDRMLSKSFNPAQQIEEVGIGMKNDNLIENLVLGQATAYINPNYKTVYFDYYKKGKSALNEAAFFVYTSDPKSTDPRYDQLKKLKNSWFFLVRGYAD